MKLPNYSCFSIFVSLVIFLGACGGGVGIVPTVDDRGSGSNTSETPSFSQFRDIPIPTGAQMDLDRTVILGPPETWIGRLTLEASHNPVALFNFFKQRAPGFGWQEVTSIRSATSFLTYTKAIRVLTIQITSKTLRGSEVVMTVSPKGQPESLSPAPSNRLLPQSSITPSSVRSLPPPRMRQ